jgi:septal ring factor EnvC (AmiA/AmiB activator)
MNFRPVFIAVLISFLTNFMMAQDDYQSEIRKNQSQLKKINSEINALKGKLSSTYLKESNVSKQLKLLDHQIALLSQKKGLLQKEYTLLQKKIDQNNASLKKTKARLKKLENLYAKRIVHAYKYGRASQLDYILKSESINQAFIRYKYFDLIAEHDERTIKSIVQQRNKVKNLQVNLKKSRNRKGKILAEKKEESLAYNDSKRKKQSLLKKIYWDAASFRKRLKEKEEEKSRLAGIIMALEHSRKNKQKQTSQESDIYLKFDDFKKAKGKLPWPVKGKIVSKYGKQRDPKTKTTIINTDIVIKSRLGTPVKSVFNGLAKMITYLPGYGNTIIVDHGKGYYTVYAHLDEIYIHKDDYIKTGQIIATVGDSGSLDGAKLQFGIYGGQKTYNPVKWLK